MTSIIYLLWSFIFRNEPFNIDINGPVVLVANVTDQRSRDTFCRYNRTHARRLHSIYARVHRTDGGTAHGKLGRTIALIVKIEIVHVFRGGHAGRGGAER